MNQLKRFWDTQRETEESDPGGQQRVEDNTDEDGISGADEDAFLDKIYDELSERARVLGDTYPFQFCKTTLRFAIKDHITDGSYVYLFCLLLTNCKAGEVFTGLWLPIVNSKIRDLFQACSTLAAAGKVRGCAISFGWPRPNDNPSFLKRLRDVYTEFGEGEPVAKPPKGTSMMVKDGEIDIIAWSPRPDKVAGTFYLLGQVASGANWEAKSIKGGSIDHFHSTWFSRPPVSQPLASIFIPHAVPPSGEGTRRDRIEVLTAKFGIIVDRLCLPTFARDGISLADNPTNNFLIERRRDIPKIVKWVVAQRTALKQSGEMPL